MMNFKQYNNVTKIVIPDGISLTNKNFYMAFNNMTKVISISIPNSVTNILSAYQNCYNLSGPPVCSLNVTHMGSAYYNCTNLTGLPVCGNNVINMSYTYYNCSNLTGTPVCGENVTDMTNTYRNCHNLTGSPVCGSNVKSMTNTYRSCYNLTGAPVCGNNVTNLYYTYENCPNLFGNSYFYSNKVYNAVWCFHGRNAANILNLYTVANSTTMNTFLANDYYTSIVGAAITWTDDTATNGCYYNTQYNIYIYPVEDVAAARTANGDD